MKYLISLAMILSACLFFAYGFAHARMNGASNVNTEALKQMFTSSSFLPITVISILCLAFGLLSIKLLREN